MQSATLLVLIVLLTQTVVITGLVVQRVRRQRAEHEMRRRHSELSRTATGRIRDLGARLLNAQEAERARIARELHDDVSQQLSLLALDLAMLRGNVHDPLKEAIDEASFRTESILRSVHALSHRLHPYKVQLIGLVPALQGLQSTVSQAGLPVTFTHETVPARVPPDLTLSLFRIVQEALQNALKHSRARTVSMQLTGGPTEIRLTIVDDGIGLVSIRERLDAIGGTFDISSESGAGTRLEIRAPIPDIDH